MKQAFNPSGMRAFLIIWIGQLVSLVGSQLTGFAMGVWVYDETRSVLMLALTMVALQAPLALFSPLAGVLADRWDRRNAMILSDSGAGLAVLTAGILYLSHQLQPWMVIPLNFVMSSFSALMWPAYSASVTLLVPREQYGRANGLVQLGEAIPQIAGPAIAGVLYVVIHVGNMALIDFATYVFAAALMVLFVKIPRPPISREGHGAKGSVWKEMKFGWEYITARRGLLLLLTYFLIMNFLFGIMQPLFVPLILDNWDARILGVISTLMGAGMLVGTLVMSAWGGSRRKIYTLLGGGLLSSMFVALFGIRASIPLLAACGFGFMFMEPFMNASSQAIWQSKVAPDVQGRVFGVRRMIAWSAQVAAPLLAAPLVDHVFKPAMSAGGLLAPVLSPVFGAGANRGVGVLISLLGLLSVGLVLVAFANRHIRNVESDLPDHNTSPNAPETLPLSEPAD
jgi:DHA3 family macrolide efflux protein-like MFS transporter